jgi:hypothetical protein
MRVFHFAYTRSFSSNLSTPFGIVPSAFASMRFVGLLWLRRWSLISAEGRCVQAREHVCLNRPVTGA